MTVFKTKLSRWKVSDVYFLLYCLTFMANIGFSNDEFSATGTLPCPDACLCDRSTGIVNCSSRSLKRIPDGIPSWVTNLSLRNNKISSEEISSLDLRLTPHLQELDLSDNKIQNFTVDLTGTYSLSRIILNHCSLLSIPRFKSNVVNNITHLSISHNLITDIDQHLWNFPNLLMLDLSFNKVKTLKTNGFSNRNLTHIFLQRNRLTIFDHKAFRGLPSVSVLDLSRNKIKLIAKPTDPTNGKQKCFGYLRNLTRLDLSRNQLTHIDGLSFKGMCSLVSLLLQRNKITKLHDGAFYGPFNLKTLILDSNFITSVTKGWLFELHSLATLSVSRNNITKIEPDGWDFCKSLLHLNLSYNFLYSLRQNGFSLLAKLESLNLDHNKIAVMEDYSFNGLGNLKQLDISHNVISSSVEDINGAFHGLSSIETLNLRQNKIRTLSASVLEGLETVIYIDLRENNITSIQNHTFDDMVNLQTLHIMSSSFLCDCQIAWFPLWLNQMNGTDFVLTIQGKCFHPSALKGRDLMTIQPSEFVCGVHPVPVLIHQPIAMIAPNGDNVTLECSASATIVESENETKNSSDVEENNPSKESFLSLQADTGTEQINKNKNKMTVTWKRGQNIITEGHNIKIRNLTRHEAGYVYFTSVLLLDRVTIGDGDLYSCIITNEYGFARSEPAELKVYELPEFLKRPQLTIAKNGSEAIIDCAAKGYPLPLISWKKVGYTGPGFPAANQKRLLREQTTIRRIISPFNEHKKTQNKGGLVPLQPQLGVSSNGDSDINFAVDPVAPLHIGVVLPEDAGEYECVAKSEAGEIKARATLIVLIPPSFLKPMKASIKAVLGTNSVLQCMAQGNPKPSVLWVHNSRPLNETERHFLAADGQLLVIVETKESDAGSYNCLIENKLGNEKGVTELHVFQNLSDLEDEDFWSAMFGGNTTTGIILIVIFACVVITSFVWLIILCYTRRHPEEALSTNTDCPSYGTDVSPIDSYDSTDDSIRKGQSSHSIHSCVDNDMNVVHAMRSVRDYPHYPGPSSAPDMQIHPQYYPGGDANNVQAFRRYILNNKEQQPNMRFTSERVMEQGIRTAAQYPDHHNYISVQMKGLSHHESSTNVPESPSSSTADVRDPRSRSKKRKKVKDRNQRKKVLEEVVSRSARTDSIEEDRELLEQTTICVHCHKRCIQTNEQTPVVDINDESAKLVNDESAITDSSFRHRARRKQDVRDTSQVERLPLEVSNYRTESMSLSEQAESHERESLLSTVTTRHPPEGKSEQFISG